MYPHYGQMVIELVWVFFANRSAFGAVFKRSASVGENIEFLREMLDCLSRSVVAGMRVGKDGNFTATHEYHGQTNTSSAQIHIPTPPLKLPGRKSA